MKQDKELIELEHKYKMEEIEAERVAKLEVHKNEHENKMAEIRLKNANIQRTIQEKSYLNKS